MTRLLPCLFAMVVSTLCTAALPAAADVVQTDDYIIQNSLCVGTSCVSGEDFGDDTIRLRSNNPRIHVDDTSATGAPSMNWRMRFNDHGSVVGGRDHFAIENADTDAPLFVIEGSAPASAMTLGADGHVGIATALPAAALHIVSNDYAPRIRIDENDGTPGSWDIIAYDSAFEVRNAQTSRTPLSISSGAPSWSQIVKSDGKIGFGVYAPDAALHVQRSTGDAALIIEETSAGTLGQLQLKNNGITYFTLEDTSLPEGDNTGRAWNFQNQAGTFRVTTAPGGPGEIEMQIDAAGDMYLKGQLYTGTGGATTTCASGCDAVFDDGYELPSFAEHMAAIREHGHLPAVGPTPEDGPHNLSRMVGGALNELEKSYLYIDQLHARIAQLETALAQNNADLRQRLAQVESSLAR